MEKLATNRKGIGGGVLGSLECRILFIVNGLHSGGAEKQLLWMASVLIPAGVPCAIFELQSNPGNARLNLLIERAAAQGVELFRAGRGAGYIRAWRKLRMFVHAHPSAILWTWGFRSDFFVLSVLGKNIHQRWICSLRNANRVGLRRARYLIRLCGPKVTMYASNTQANCEMLREVYPQSVGRTMVIYNYASEIDHPPANLPRNIVLPLRVVMLGNIDIHRKGYDLVVQLGALIKRAGWPIEIHIAGRLDSGKAFDLLIERHRVKKQIIYHGETGSPDQFLLSGHCFLLASRFEGTPNALLEAMAFGLPAIATKVGDLARLAKDRCELRLVNIEDVSAIGDCLMEMVNDWPAALAMGVRGREWCRELFSLDVSRQQLFNVVRTAATWMRPKNLGELGTNGGACT